jgi:hypothetical protein
MSRTYYFHYPPPTVASNWKQKRYTVAFTLEKTQDATEDQNEWVLSYGATIYTPDLNMRETIKNTYQTPHNCENCKQNKGLCENCKPIRDNARKLMLDHTWNKSMHVQRARERLSTSPLRFVLWSESGTRMHHYQFRRIEKFILKRIHQYGVENRQAITEPLLDYAEYGYTLMEEALTRDEQQDYDRFLQRVRTQENENDSDDETESNSNTDQDYIETAALALTISMNFQEVAAMSFICFMFFLAQLTMPRNC